MKIYSYVSKCCCLLIPLALSLNACSKPVSGPDKTLAGSLMGGMWGAGAGAVVGNQLPGSNTGPGMAVGAGFGAISGALTGGGLDLNEQQQIDQEERLASLKIQNMANARELEIIQNRLDKAITSQAVAGVYQVFFDADETSIRAGSLANLEVLAESLKRSPAAYTVQVVGHSDDSGTPDYNERVAESRARAVSAYLGSRGILMDQIIVRSFGSQRPIASNTSETGRQLNRRVDVYIGK